MKELRIPINSRIVLFEFICPECSNEFYTSDGGIKKCPYFGCRAEYPIEPNGSFTSFPREIKET